jgi:hypothetical protein
MASEGEDTGSEGGGGPGHPPFRRLEGGAATAPPEAAVRLIREYKGRMVGDQPLPPATALPGRVAAAGVGAPTAAGASTEGGLLAGPGARRRAVRRRWLLGAGALALLTAAALSGWLLWLAGTR